jgi:hypothetical protein
MGKRDRVRSSAEGRYFFFTASRSDLGPTQPPIQWVPGDLSPGVKKPKLEADHSPPSSAKVKNDELCLHSPILLHGMGLIRHRNNFPEDGGDIFLRYACGFSADYTELFLFHVFAGRPWFMSV